MKEIISKPESEVMEFKKSTGEWKEIVKTISAFSNTRGGTVIVGVDGKGNIVGVSIGKDTIEQLTNKIISNTEPKVYPEISVKDIKGKNLIFIKVNKYPYDVVLSFGRPFKRIGKSTVKMSKDRYEKIRLMARKYGLK